VRIKYVISKTGDIFPLSQLTRNVLALGVFFSLGAAGQVLTMAQAVHYAIAHSPNLDTAFKNADIAELQRKIVLSQFFPSLGFTSTNGILHAIPNTLDNPTDPWTSSLGLTATETLYDNGISLLQYGQSKVNQDFANLTQTKTRDQLCLKVITDFFAYSLAQQSLYIEQETLKNTEKQFLSVSDMYEQGFKTRADFLRLKTQVQRNRLDLLTAENALASSVVELRRALGASQSDADTLTFEPIDPEKVSSEVPTVKLSPESSYEYRLAKIEAQSTEFNIDIAKRNYWPQVNLSAGGNYGYGNYLGPPGNAGGEVGWNLLLSVNYNIFDFGLRRHQVEVTESQQMISENAVTLARVTAKAALDNIMLSFNELKPQYDIAHELWNLEKENYDLIRENYQEGKVQYLDLITSLTNLFSAKQAFMNAAFGLAQTVAKYHYYEGTIYASASKE
jgi:outer membrane protein TolC